MTQPNASLLKSRKRQRPESNRNGALTVTPGANASGSLSPRQPQLAESLTRPTGTHAMQRTIFLAITLFALMIRVSWAQTSAAEPAATPPAPPMAIAPGSQTLTNEAAKSEETSPLMIEEPKANDPRAEEFRQIIQLLVDRKIAKLVPPTVPAKPADSYPTIAFTFVPQTNGDAIRGLLIDLSLINIPNLRVTISDQSKIYNSGPGVPPIEAHIPNYESIERQRVVALWKLFKQRKVEASFSSGKRNLAYGIPQMPDPVLGAETTEQIKVEVGYAGNAYTALREVLRKDGPPYSFGYDEKTNSLLVDRRDGVSNEVKELLNRWQKYYAPPRNSPPSSIVGENTQSTNLAPSEAPSPATELLEQEMLRFVGRWRLISLNEHRENLGELSGVTFTRKGNELEVTSLLNQTPPEPSIATLEVSDTPEQIRRIKIVTKLPSGEPKSMLAVYAISGVEGSNDNPLRLKMNFTRGKNYPTSLEERGEGIEQLECEYIPPSEGALGLPASAIPGKVWITSGTAIVAIADDGKSAAAYCEQHPTWVSIQLDPTITAQPKSVADAFDVAVQHGSQCHAYSMSLGTWSTLTLPAGEEAVANLEPFPSGGSVDFKAHSNVSVHSKTQGDYVFKDRWGKWFSAEEIKAGKVAEHLAAQKAKNGETAAPSAPAVVSSGAKPEVTPEIAKQLEPDLARFAGHWTLIWASHAQVRPDVINRITFQANGNQLVATFVEPWGAQPATTAKLDVSDAPDRIRRIQFLGDASISGSKSFLAVYEFSPAEGPSDGPLRLKLNISKNGTWPKSMNDLGENYFQVVYLKLPATEALSSPPAANPASSITKIFTLQHTQATDAMELLKQLYDQTAVKIAVDTRTNAVIAIGPQQKLEEIEALLKRLDVPGPMAPATTSDPLASEAAKLIAQLEDERVILLQDLGDQHPKILAIDARLAQARSRIAGSASHPFKEVLRQQMEKALGELLQAKGTEDQSVQDAKAKIETILAEFDKAPNDTRRAALTHIASMENVALSLRDEEFARWQGALEETKEKDPIYLALRKHRSELRQKVENRQPFPFANSLTNISPSEGRLVIQEILVELHRECAKLAKQLKKDDPRIAQFDNTVGKISKELAQLGAELDETELEECSQVLKASYLAWLKAPTFPRIIRDKLEQKLKETGAADEVLMRDLAFAVVFERYRNWEREALVQPKPINTPPNENSAGTHRATESQMLPYVQACLAELKSERDEIIQKDGKDHPDIAHLNASVAELEAKIQQIQTNGKTESDQHAGEMKQALDMLPESIERMRLERNNLVKSDPQNPRIRELDMHIAATKVMQRTYSGVIAAHVAGDASSLPSLHSSHINATKSPADLSRQITQLRKDYAATEAEAQRLAEQLRQPGSTASKDELKKIVERSFTLRQSLLRAELGEMLDRLEKTQHSIDLRDRITDQIVTRRVEELLNPQLEWDGSKSGEQPVAPSTPPQESAQIPPQEWTAKLQGHWQLTQIEYEQVDTSNGKKPGPDDIKRENWNPETYYREKSTRLKAMIDGNQMSICGEDGSNPMTMELTYRKAGPPQQVDLTPVMNAEQLAEFKRMAEESQGSSETPAFKCIIEETPDGFRMCLDMKGTGTRPFLFVLGPDTCLWEFRREAAAPTAPPKESAQIQPQEWTAKLQGPWLMYHTGFEQVTSTDGKLPLTDEKGGAVYHKKTTTRKVVIDGNLITVCDFDGQVAETCELKFRNAGPPQQVDLTQILNKTQMDQLVKNLGGSSDPIEFLTSRGIIEETVDGFQLCIKDGGAGNRPSLFVMGPETTLFKFSRPPTQPQEQAADKEAPVQPESKPAESKKPSPSDTETAQAAQMTAKQLTLLFLAILERRPTDREEEAWLNSMRNGQSVTDVVSTLLANSKVFDQLGRDKAEYIKYLHKTLLVRAPTEDELRYWSRRYDELKEIRHEFAREFLNSIGESSISELMARQAAVSQPLKPAAEAPAAPASEPSPKDATGKKRNALVATRDIPAGYPLTDFNVVMVEIPASIQVPEGGEFVQTPQEYEQRSLRMSVPSGSLIRKADLGEKGVFKASMVIPKGMRINTFPVTDVQTHSGMLKPDDRVDVKVGYTTPKGIVEVKTLLESVRVFACEDKTVKGENGQPVLRSRFVTLLVTPEQDGYLEIAKMKGQLSLSLRNPDDDELVNRHGLNTALLKELRHVKGLGEPSSQATTTELDGDWHLLWTDNGEWKSRYAANMTIHGDQCSFSKQKTGSKGQITIDAKAKTVHWSNMVATPSMPAEVPPIPSDLKGSYELSGDRLTIRSPEGPQLFVWGRGLCDLRAAKSPPDGMALFPVRDVKSPVDLGQFNPGDKVDVSAEWELPDGSRSTGLVAELVEIDTVMYGDPKAGNAVLLLGNPDQVKLIEAVWSRSKLTLVARKPGDEVLKLPGGINTSVLTEIKAAAGADPVTPLEGDWYLESQEMNGDITGHRANMTIRGDVWSKKFLIGNNHDDTKKLTGILRINKQDHSYVISDWPQLGIIHIKDEVRYHVGENGTFELTGDKLIMKGRELPEHATLTRTWGRGHRPFVPPLSSVSATRKLRWRSGIVEIFLGRGDTLGKRLDGVEKGDGMGVVVSPDGLIVGNPRNSAFHFANSDAPGLHARFDDGSFVKLTLVEDAKNDWLTFKPEKEMRVNHFFPIATTPTAIADEVYAWGTNISGSEHFLDVFQSKILLMDRRLSGTSDPVWQLMKPDHWGRASGLPILSAEGELLALTMPDTGDLVLALPASRLKAMFPKSFPATTEPHAAPAEATKPAATP